MTKKIKNTLFNGFNQLVQKIKMYFLKISRISQLLVVTLYNIMTNAIFNEHALHIHHVLFSLISSRQTPVYIQNFYALETQRFPLCCVCIQSELNCEQKRVLNINKEL